jgi:hypothetical protein
MEQRIAEIRARVEKATPGPWEPVPDGCAACTETEWDVDPLEIGCHGMFAHFIDADFIAHAREDIPYLLSLLAERDAEIARLRQEFWESQQANGQMAYRWANAADELSTLQAAVREWKEADDAWDALPSMINDDEAEHANQVIARCAVAEERLRALVPAAEEGTK